MWPKEREDEERKEKGGKIKSCSKVGELKCEVQGQVWGQ